MKTKKKVIKKPKPKASKASQYLNLEETEALWILVTDWFNAHMDPSLERMSVQEIKNMILGWHENEGKWL